MSIETNPTSNTPTPTTNNKKDNRLVAGGLLILIGGLMLIGQFAHGLSGSLFLGALALIFLVWGVLARKFGPIIPGGILAGIALGAYLLDGPFAGYQDPVNGGIFLLAFAAGWALISLLSIVTERGRMIYWPLIPGAVLALIGTALLSGQTGLKVLEIVGQGWGAILIVIGLYLILRRRAM